MPYVTGHTPQTESIMYDIIITGLPQVIPIRLGKTGQYGQINIDLAALPNNALQYLILYGIKQAMNDKMATKTDKHGTLTNDQIRDKVVSRVEGWYQGVVRQRGGATKIGVDRVRAEARKLAFEAIKVAYDKKGYMVNIPKGTKDRQLFVANRFRDQAGKEPFATKDEWLDYFLALPTSAILMERAARNIKEENELAGEGDELLDMLKDIEGDTDDDGDDDADEAA